MFLLFLLLVPRMDSVRPVLFAPGQVASTGFYTLAPAFTPDGNTVCFFQGARNGGDSLMIATRRNGRWSAPRVAVFSGRYRDIEPAFSPDGRYLIFASSRPERDGDTAVSGWYNGKVYPASGGRLWRVTRNADTWGTPEMLPATVNANTSVFSPAVTADGSLYYMRADSGKAFHIYRSAMKNGVLQPPEPMPFALPDHGDYDPVLSPDESYLIFSSGRAPAPHTADIFIVFRQGGGWSDPIDLRTALSADVHGTESRLSPDGKTLYFTKGPAADGTYGIWQVDLSGLLRAHGL